MTLLDHPEDTILGKIPLDDCSLPHRHHYLTKHNNHKREIHVPGGIWRRNPSKGGAVEPRLIQCGHWDRH